MAAPLEVRADPAALVRARRTLEDAQRPDLAPEVKEEAVRTVAREFGWTDAEHREGTVDQRLEHLLRRVHGEALFATAKPSPQSPVRLTGQSPGPMPFLGHEGLGVRTTDWLASAGHVTAEAHPPEPAAPFSPPDDGPTPPPPPALMDPRLRVAARFSSEVQSELLRLMTTAPSDLQLRALRSTLASIDADKSLSRSKKNAKAIRALGNLAQTPSAARATPALPPAVAVPSAPDRLYSRPARAELDSKLGPDARPFFELHRRLADLAANGTRPPESLAQEVEASVVQLHKVRGAEGEEISPALLHDAHRGATELSTLFGALTGTPIDGAAWSRIGSLYGGLARRVAQDRGIYLTVPEGQPWGAMRLMSPAERKQVDLATSDPELSQVLTRRRLNYQELQAALEQNIRANGMEPSRKMIRGRVAAIGTDPQTREERVFDIDGDVLPLPEYLAKRDRFLKGQDKLRRPLSLTDRQLAALRSVPDEVLATLPGPVEYESLTDDKAKAGQLTRIYPTKVYDGFKVIVEGRFKGVFKDDLVNSEGRLIEGTAYRYSTRSRRAYRVPVKRDPSEREPYVTTAEVTERGVKKEKLFLRLPRTQGEWTAVRNAVRTLSKSVPSVQYREHSRNAVFTFEPKDFEAVREAVRGMSMSSSALGLLRGYFDHLTVIQQAGNAENLQNFSEASLPGFKTEFVDSTGKVRPFRLTTTQKTALARLEANHDRGVAALDTGDGKTLTAIAMMQKLMRDGASSETGTRGRFLYVCPKAQVGNLIKEIHAFLTPEAADRLLARVDVLSYEEFVQASKTGQWDGKPFGHSGYGAAFFDEAQTLRKITTQGSRAAFALGVPKTVLLTGSPIVDSPMDAYVLASLANGVNLVDPVGGRVARREMRKFRDRYTATVGGRTVGITRNPVLKRELDTWIKRNVFYSDKTQSAEVKLPALESHSEALVMSPEVEAEYRKLTSEVRTQLKGMVALYRERGRDPAGRIIPIARDPKLKSAVFDLRKLFAQLNLFSVLPERFVPGAGKPKLDQAAQIIWEKLEKTDQSKAVLFAEDPEVVVESARYLSTKIPGKIHAACLGDVIRLFKDGEELKKLDGMKLPFRARDYQAKPEPGSDGPGRSYSKREWQQFVLDQVLSPSRQVASATMQGQVYQTGQNLQAFDTVIHLDRDTWSGENMKQRTARLWRQGQNNPVDEHTLDLVFREPKERYDATLDEIRSAYQALGDEIFSSVIKDPQQLVLGSEWLDMRRNNASRLRVYYDAVDLLASPYIQRAARTGTHDVP